jgi:putative aminopeptidase FrvX
MGDLNTAFLKRLCEADGVSGREDAIAAILREELAAFSDEVRVDAIKNVTAVRRGDGGGLRVMLAGHIDEIGFLVFNIDDDGFISLAPIGGWTAENMIGHPVRIHTRRSGIVAGVVQRRAAWLPEHSNRLLRLDELYIDTGMKKDQVVEKVSRGDWVSMATPFGDIGSCFLAKAFDDRVGVFIMAEAFKRYSNPAIEVSAVGTSQEEVGLRGSTVAAQEVRPDIAIAVDITGAGDVPEYPARLRIAKLGDGVAIKYMDGSVISSPELVDFVRGIAEEKGIDHQMEILLAGGTDTASIQKWGAGPHVICLSIPTRYGHGPGAVIHRHDVETAIELLTEVLNRIHLFRP